MTVTPIKAAPVEAPEKPVRLLTVEEAADLLGVSVHYVYERTRNGTIPYVDLGVGRAKYRIRSDHFMDFVDSLTHSTKGAA